jgi:hypothetical protein
MCKNLGSWTSSDKTDTSATKEHNEEAEEEGKRQADAAQKKAFDESPAGQLYYSQQRELALKESIDRMRRRVFNPTRGAQQSLAGLFGTVGTNTSTLGGGSKKSLLGE